MIFHRHTPSAPLNKYVDCIVYVEGNNKGVGFPKTAMSLAFNLHDSFKLFDDDKFLHFTDHKKYWVAGLQTQPSYIENYGQSKMVVIQFRTFGACAFLQQPLRYFTNGYIDLDCVFKKEADDVWCQLAESKTVAEKFCIAEAFLCRKFSGNTIPDIRLISSIGLLSKGNVPVSAVCRQYNISRKHLNFLYQEYLGISPKTFSSLSRFQAILHKISRTKVDNLTSVAYELDFFDQAHFNNSFKKFTGIRPTDYINSIEKKPSLKTIPHFLPVE